MEQFDTSQFGNRSVEARYAHCETAQPGWSEPNPFYEPWFLDAAREWFDPDRRVRMFEVPEVGIVPLRRSHDYYDRPVPHWTLWRHDQCFLATPLVRTGCERQFWKRLLSWCDDHAGTSLFLHCPLQHLAGPVFEALRDVVIEEERSASMVGRHERALLRSKLLSSDYQRQSLSAGRRKELRRQLRRLREEGEVSFESLSNGEGLAGWIDEYLRLEAAGWKGRSHSALGRTEAARKFFADSLTAGADTGRLQRRALRLDGRPIAMLATFVAAPGAFLFKTAYDERYARFSPGVLLQCENLDLLDRQDIAFADSCASAGHPMIEAIWQERRSVGGVNIAIGGKLRRHAARAMIALDKGSELL